AVRDHERERCRPRTAHVDEVDAEAADAGAELREGVEPRLGRAPVEALTPVGDQVAQVGEVRAVGPARAGDLVGEARAREALAQVGQDGVGDGDAEGLDVHARRCTPDVLRPTRVCARGGLVATATSAARPRAPAGETLRSRAAAGAGRARASSPRRRTAPRSARRLALPALAAAEGRVAEPPAARVAD